MLLLATTTILQTIFDRMNAFSAIDTLREHHE